MARVLLVGRLPGITATVQGKLSDLAVDWVGATSIDEVTAALRAHGDIGVAVVGAGLDDDTRGRLIGVIAAARPDISIHLKDRASGPGGMAPFVRAVVQAMLLQQDSRVSARR